MGYSERALTPRIATVLMRAMVAQERLESGGWSWDVSVRKSESTAMKMLQSPSFIYAQYLYYGHQYASTDTSNSVSP